MLGALLEVSLILVLVGLNGVLAASEIAVVTSRKARLRQRAEGGDAGSARALALANDPSRFLSTVQIGITAIAVVAGAFGGTRVAVTLVPVLERWGLPPGAASVTAVGVVVVLITFVALVAGELVPKRIALHDPERLAARVSGGMERLAAVAAPLVRVLEFSTDAVLRLLRASGSTEPEVTEDEIRSMIAHATESGILEPTEQRITERLFRLSDVCVELLMTPREEIVWLDRQGGPDEWRRTLSEVRHTRYIVADGELDAEVGFVKVQDLLERSLSGEEPNLDSLLRRCHRVDRWTPALRLLSLFQWSGDHIALVTGGDGRVEGLVTLNNILEGIVGDLPEMEAVLTPGVIEREDGSLLVDGLLPFDDLLSMLGLADETPSRFPTLHAFMVDALEGEPRVAGVARWRGVALEVVDMDASRVDKVLVTGGDGSEGSGAGQGPR
jgi:putative hemolysin